ncbi:START domain-containing protein [Deltaproteobacteria bacterium TL4]
MKKILGRLVKNAMIAKGDWKEVNEKNGILVHYKTIENSNIFAFKGQAVFSFPLAQIAHALEDHDGRMKWTDLIIASREIECVSEQTIIIYQAFKPPFPVAKRDYVIEATWEVDKDDMSVLLDLTSVEHEDAPDTVGVRALLHESSYYLKDIGNGKTAITVEIHTDPLGKIPPAIANLIQREWPYKTLRDLRDYLSKAPYAEHEFVKKRLYG